MSYTFDPNQMYRMPTHFGPSTGPRRGPDGKGFDCIDSPKRTSVSVSFLSNPDQLAAMLPPGFELGDKPVVTVTAGFMTEIEWLGGRGYATMGLTFPAVYKGEEETVRGPFLTVLWENLADPIITGREELGFSKIYCELPDPRICQGTAHVTAGWLGCHFMDLKVTDMKKQEIGDGPAKGGGGGKTDGTLHLKYMPRTGEWGTQDTCYTVMTPASGGNGKTLERWVGEGSVEWHPATWQDLPTFYMVVNTFAELEVKEYLGGSVVRSVGGKDLSDQRIVK